MVKKALKNFKSVEILNTPNLLYPSINDNCILGNDINICSKDYARNFNKPKIAKEFWQKFQISNNIIIIDDYFYKIPIDFIVDFLKKDAQLRIYTGRNIKNIKEKLKYIEGKKIFLFQTLGKLKIHDRFAILDNELFHFGSTVGGHEEHFTAYSRGWNPTKIKGLLDFLESKNSIYENYIKEVQLQ